MTATSPQPATPPQGSATNPAMHPDFDRLQLPEPPAPLKQSLEQGSAVAWSQPLTIRTYEAGPASEYPMYLDHRVYQGSSGRVYPIPFTEKIADEPALREWQAIHLENQYVRLVVLPELGGRIHVGYDKVTGYDFFYRNNVIKPALVGLAGPWISGGVEFNWPQHHRPATYLPVETLIETSDDGSVTVWCSDHDPFDRMHAQHGVRLRPDSAVVELVVRLHNRTDQRHTFLWWANVAARVHDDYQAFFPEDVRYVADHARRALTAFPSADRPYYGVDYPRLAAETPGADRIDYYGRIPVPTSYMVVDSWQDFFGGYDHAAGAGFVHWAERRISPGKKQWTWGNAPFGHAWDAQLTDEDGPYVELMAGVYTDNQPDFSWILPGETKSFSQYWYPIPAMGTAHQATTDAAVHVDHAAKLSATFAVTSPQPGATLRLLRNGAVIASRQEDLSPGHPVTISADGPADGAPAAELLDAHGRCLVRWVPVETSDEEPWVADEPPLPAEISSVEELYLTGVHLAQYRHPTRSPLPYWQAALERDPSDVRTRLAMADRAYRCGEFDRALEHIDVALARLTRRNANPADAEAYYLQGLVLQRLGRVIDAERAFGKAGWDGTWAAAAGFSLAQSLARRGQVRSSLRVLDSLDGVVGHDARRAALQVLLLRRVGDHEAASRQVRAALAVDPLDATLRTLSGDAVADDAGILLDVALDLRNAGAYDAALDALARAARASSSVGPDVRPVAHYLAAQLLDEQGETSAAAAARRRAQDCSLRWVFPSGLDAMGALEAAIAIDGADDVAHSLLGMLLYGVGRREDARRHWDAALALGRRDPVLLRNAALADYNVGGDDSRARARYEEAVALAPDDARLLYEYDQLISRLGDSAASRLARLRPLRSVALTRDDFTIEYVRLLLEAGEPEAAYEILTRRSFRPWEGGEGQALAAWDATLAALGRSPQDPPATLGEARPQYTPPVARHDDGATDYFATSLPELLLFARPQEARADR